MTLMIPSKNNRHASNSLDPVYNFPPLHDAIPYYIPFVIHYKLIIPYYVPFHFRRLLDHRCCRHPSLQDRTNTPDPLPHLYLSASFSRDSSGEGDSLFHTTLRAPFSVTEDTYPSTNLTHPLLANMTLRDP